MKEQPIETYMHQELDNDGTYYWWANRDVVSFWNQDNQVKAIFDRFKARSEQWMYIKWNEFFFTLKGVKYTIKLTSTEWEWSHIQELIKELEPLIEGYYYYSGILD